MNDSNRDSVAAKRNVVTSKADARTLLNFPIVHMTGRSQWILFVLTPRADGKPSKRPMGGASSTDSKTWKTWKAATGAVRKGSATAAAYALTEADRIVFIDLDGPRWVSNGKPTAEARELVRRLRSYAELSISGTGIHVLARGRLPDGTRHKSRCGTVELYDRDRFCIVTGRQLEGTPGSLRELEQADMPLILKLVGSKGRASGTEGTEKDRGTDDIPPSVLSGTSGPSVPVITIPVDGCMTAAEAIADTLPTKGGQRHDCLLKLARALKFECGRADLSDPSLKKHVREWHRQALPFINTKAFDESWRDYCSAHRAAKVPLMADPLRWASRQPKVDPKVAARAEEYDTEEVRDAIWMCYWLSSAWPDRRFFLSCRSLAEFTGVRDHKRAAGTLTMLCDDGVIEVAEPGNQRRATRYRWVADRKRRPPRDGKATDTRGPSPKPTRCKFRADSKIGKNLRGKVRRTVDDALGAEEPA